MQKSEDAGQDNIQYQTIVNNNRVKSISPLKCAISSM